MKTKLLRKLRKKFFVYRYDTDKVMVQTPSEIYTFITDSNAIDWYRERLLFYARENYKHTRKPKLIA